MNGENMGERLGQNSAASKFIAAKTLTIYDVSGVDIDPSIRSGIAALSRSHRGHSKSFHSR